MANPPLRVVPSDAPDTLTAALALTKLGYHVTPCYPRKKGARLKDWPNQILTASDVERLFRPGDNLGLMLGTEVFDGRFLFAVDIDVDDPQLISRARLALGGDPPAKRGMKGITFFALAPRAVATKKLHRLDTATNRQTVPLEILCTTYQTVIPPSIHPDTDRPYEWVGRPLTDFSPIDLTLVNLSAFDELECAVKSPDSPLFAINDVWWNGPGGAAGVDDALRSSTAAMVARGWDDDAIQARVARAVVLMLAQIDPDVARQWDETVHLKRLDSLIEGARKKGFDVQAKRRKPSRQEMRTGAAEQLMTFYGGVENLWRHGPNLRRYGNGYWSILDPQRMLYDAHNLDRSWVQPDDAKAVVELVRNWAPWVDKEPARAVCFLNGTFMLDDRKLEPWAPGDRLTAQIKFEYDPRARACPNYDEVLLSVFHLERDGPTDARSDEQLTDDMIKSIGTFEEFAALSLIEELKYQKMLIIRGPTGSGKTTLATLLQEMHDPEAVQAVPIDRLHEERYLSSLNGKLLNVSTEVNADAFVDDGMLKNITGGDSIVIRKLYQEPVKAQLPTRLMVCCNRMFRTRDTSGAMERRMLLLDCGRRLEERERDGDLPVKLRAEMPAIFNRWVNAYSNLRKRGRFDPPTHMLDTLSAFSEANNHVLRWIKDHTHQGQRLMDPAYEMPQGQQWSDLETLYSHYAFWAKDKGYRVMSDSTWGAACKELGYPSAVRKVAGKTMRIRYLKLTKTVVGREF